jgi:multimeric flavodoxin WrbA
MPGYSANGIIKHLNNLEEVTEMRVIGFCASPRKKGNTATMVEAVLKGAEEKGAETRYVNLYDLNMQGCLACEGCKDKLGNCVQKDDLSPLLKELKNYDALVFGTPIYWYHVNPLLKILIDRLYCYYGWDRDPNSNEVINERFEFPPGKKFVFVTSRGDVEDTQVFPQFYEYLSEWLESVAMIMGSSSTEMLNQYASMSLIDSARNDAALLAKARAIGGALT